MDRRAVAVVAVLVAVSVVRPWGGTQSRSGSSPAASFTAGVPAGAAAAAAVTGAPSPHPSVGPDQILCSGDSSQLVSLDRLGAWTVRTWIDAVPVIAAGPTDPAIGMVVLESPAVLAIGMCLPVLAGAGLRSPRSGEAGVALSDRGAPVVEAWTAVGGQMRSLPIEALRPDGGAPDLAILYRPSRPTIDQLALERGAASRGDRITRAPGTPGEGAPAAGDQSPLAWPPGRYVLRLEPVRSGGPGVGDLGPLDGPALFIAIEVADRS